MFSRLATAVLVLAVVPSPVPASDGVKRCVAPDGQTIFTDRPCGAFGARPMGAREALARSGAPATMGEDGAVGGFSIRGCARTPEALRQGVHDALMARDVNRLANFYHWSGTGASAATALMDRLEELTAAPTGAVELLQVPQTLPTAVVPSTTAPSMPSAPSPPPIGLRVLHAGAGAALDAPATTFGLHRNAGCWWIRF